MKSFQHKRGWKDILHSKPVLILLCIILLIFTWSVLVFIGKLETTKENKKIAENKVTELEKQKEELSKETAKLKTQSGIEESIREKFSVAKEGEGVILIVEDKNSEKGADESEGGFFSWFRNLFR